VKANTKSFLIVYEDDNKQLATIAQSVEQTVRSSLTVKLRTAATMTIPDLLAADCYAFLIADTAADGWKELIRVLPGINLAGRSGLLLSSAPLGTSDSFAARFKDSEIKLTVSPDCQSSAVTSWLAALAG